MAKNISLKALVKLLRSGDFTIAYHDSGDYAIYNGQYDSYDELPELAHAVYQDESSGDGYVPSEVDLLTVALGGIAISI